MNWTENLSPYYPKTISKMQKHQETKQNLRNFGLLLAIALSTVGAILWHKQHQLSLYLLSTAATFTLGALTYPSLLRPLYKLWMLLASILGEITNHLLLTLLFFLVITPLGILLKLLRKPLLTLHWESNAKSYWNIRPKEKFNPKHYEQQF